MIALHEPYSWTNTLIKDAKTTPKYETYNLSVPPDDVLTNSLVASTVDFTQKLKGGALKFNLCNCYTVRIYIHYCIYIIPVLLANIIFLLMWLYSENIIFELGFVAVGPVFIAALVRDKLFLWLIYWSLTYCCCCTKYVTYHFSRLADCIGGLHSSFGVTALVWNIIYAVDLFRFENYTLDIRTFTGLSLPILLFLVCISALPCFRHHCHNAFELTHRYLNWLAVCMLVTHIYFMNAHVFHDLFHMTYYTPSLFAIGIFILTFYPWLIIHRIKGKYVEIYPSQTGKTTAFVFPIWCPMGAVCKLSTNWMEFHVFGITPLTSDGTHRSLVVVKSLGDWTNNICSKAKSQKLKSTNFFIHRVKAPNFTQGLFNWNKVFLIATGVGVAPLLPYIIQPEYYSVEISLVWIERNPEKNYPKLIIDLLKPLDNVVLYNTATQKHTDLSVYTVRKARSFGAEAVFIVSNPSIAYSIANYANKYKIPVFASNFDV